MTNDFIVRNTSKVFARKDQSVSQHDVDVAEMKISTKDYEVNPNMELCVWKLPKDNNYLKLAPMGKFGAIVFKDMNRVNDFITECNKRMESYIC